MREITKSEKRVLIFLKKNKEIFYEKENEIINKYFKVKPLFLKKDFCMYVLLKIMAELIKSDKTVDCLYFDFVLLLRELSKTERKKWEPKVILNELIGTLEVLDN